MRQADLSESEEETEATHQAAVKPPQSQSEGCYLCGEVGHTIAQCYCPLILLLSQHRTEGGRHSGRTVALIHCRLPCARTPAAWTAGPGSQTLCTLHPSGRSMSSLGRYRVQHLPCPGWAATKMCIATVIGERAQMRGNKTLWVPIEGQAVQH